MENHVSTEIKILQKDFKSTVTNIKKTFSGQLRKYKYEMVIRWYLRILMLIVYFVRCDNIIFMLKNIKH